MRPLVLLVALAGLLAVPLSARHPSATESLAQSPQVAPRDTPARRAGTGIIRGRVLADADGHPLAKVRVTATSGAGEIAPVYTDGAGRFEIPMLPAARYSLTAQKGGYATLRLGSRDAVDPPFLVDVADASVVEGLEIRLLKTAAISGRILDDFGEPMIFVSVSAGMLEAAGAETRFVRAARPAALTDDRGEYRMGGLLPGRYVLSVSGSVEGAPPLGGNVGAFVRTMSWGRTYYPGVANAGQAQAIELGAGEERTGVDFNLMPFLPARLTVTLRDSTGQPATGVLIVLPVDSTLGMVARTLSFAVQGSTTNPAIPPRGTVSVEPGDWMVIAPASGGKTWRQISLASGEEASIDLVLSGGAHITGRVEFEGSTRPPAANLQVDVRGVGLLGGVAPRNLARTGPVPVKPDGTFEMVDVWGTVEIRPTAVPPGWTLKSVIYGDRDLLDQPLVLSGNEDITGVRVVLADQSSELSGTVAALTGRPAPGCTVLVFPETTPLAVSARRTRLQRADQNGRFTMSELPPGSYLAIAVPQVDSARWSTEDYLNTLRSSAIRVSIADREKKTATLTCGTTP